MATVTTANHSRFRTACGFIGQRLVLWVAALVFILALYVWGQVVDPRLHASPGENGQAVPTPTREPKGKVFFY